MVKLDFIRANLPVTLLVADRVEEILPKLLAAAPEFQPSACNAAARSAPSS